MKNINLYGLLLFSATLLMNSGCTEDTLPTVPQTNTVPPSSTPPPTETIPPTSTSTPPPTNTTEPPNNAFTAYAGSDILVIFPVDFCWLSGVYSNVEDFNIDNVLWKKISGPTSYILENPNSLRTKVSQLEKGIYEFELTITNKRGLTGKDIVRITVGEMSENKEEVILRDLAWVCPMGCSIQIENIYSYLPAGSVFRIYIQRDNSTSWEEVIHESSELPTDIQYTYTLYNGNLFIFSYSSSEMKDTPNIKIVY